MLISVHSFAQGIAFEKGDWQSVTQKAINAHKLLYVDVYTSWCAPCKFMAKKYFPEKEAGDSYNNRFISYQIDAEKGEGVEIARKYAVNGFPTNLFIDPTNGNIVYRIMGMPETLSDFIQNGTIALEEYNDPMKPAQYAAKLHSGKYDHRFLRRYLEKNKRLRADNDPLIDIYLDKLASEKISDSTLLLITDYQTGVDNKGFRVLDANKSRLDALMNRPGYFDDAKERYYYQSLEKAVSDTDELKLKGLLARIEAFNLKDPENIAYVYSKKFYTKINSVEKLKEVNTAYANLLLNTNDEAIEAVSQKYEPGLKEQIMWQAKQMGTSAEKIDEILALNLKRPEIKYRQYLAYADILNSIAWDIYESNKGSVADKEEVVQATKWAERAMSLSKPVISSWLANADTYSHLLSLQGAKEKAKAIQQEVVAKAKETNDESLKDYEQFLDELN
jgi:thioredoxin-related protein